VPILPADSPACCMKKIPAIHSVGLAWLANRELRQFLGLPTYQDRVFRGDSTSRDEKMLLTAAKSLIHHPDIERSFRSYHYSMPASFLNGYYRMSSNVHEMLWQYQLLVATSATTTARTSSSASIGTTSCARTTSLAPAATSLRFRPTLFDFNFLSP